MQDYSKWCLWSSMEPLGSPHITPYSYPGTCQASGTPVYSFSWLPELPEMGEFQALKALIERINEL